VKKQPTKIRMTNRLRQLKSRFIVDVPPSVPVDDRRKREMPPRDAVEIRRELRHLEDDESKEIRGARIALLWTLGMGNAPCNVLAPLPVKEPSHG